MPTGKHRFPKGSKVIIEAIPDDGWEFVEWNGDINDTRKTITLDMDQDVTINAAFKEKGSR